MTLSVKIHEIASVKMDEYILNVSGSGLTMIHFIKIHEIYVKLARVITNHRCEVGTWRLPSTLIVSVRM